MSILSLPLHLPGFARRAPWAMIAAFTITACTVVRAQSPEHIERFRLAQAYEQNGDMDAAATVYEDLVAANPNLDVFFFGLVRTYLGLKRYDTLAVILHKRIATRGGSVGLYALLGRTLFQARHDAAAQSAWDSALVAAGPAEAGIRRVTDEMIAAHAYDAALGAFNRAAKEADNELLFAPDRANLYALLSRYSDATREYVSLLLANQQPLALVENRLSVFTMIEEADRAALAVVRAAAGDHRDNAELQYLLAWLLMERHAYADAYDVYADLDDRRNAGGQELVQFASRALAEGALDVAYRAFDHVREHAASDALAAWAAFGAAGVHEKLWRRDAPDSLPFARAVADEYDGVIAQHPSTLWADSAAVRGASIRAEALADLDGAETRLRALLSHSSRVARSGEPELLLAEVMLTRRLPDSAASAAVRVLRGRGTGPDAMQHARFLLGRLQYFAGDFDSAAALFTMCTTPPNGPYASDAIGSILLIKENSDSIGRAALRAYAAAELAMHQRDLPHAIAGLQDVVARVPTRALAEHALLATGAAYSSAGQYTHARESYQHLLDAYPESILGDRAQMRIAAIFDGPLHDPAGAIRAYEQLLQNYPSSIFQEDARLRIRALRAQL